MARRAHTTSSVPPPMPGGVRCAPKVKEPGRVRAEHSRETYTAAVRELRSLLMAVDALSEEGTEPAAIRARYFELLQVAHKASATLAHLDQLDEQLWTGGTK